MNPTPSWQAELVEKYFAKAFVGGPFSTTIDDFLAATQAAYDLGAASKGASFTLKWDDAKHMKASRRPIEFRNHLAWSISKEWEQHWHLEPEILVKKALRAAEAKGWRGAATSLEGWRVGLSKWDGTCDQIAESFRTHALSLYPPKDKPNE